MSLQYKRIGITTKSNLDCEADLSSALSLIQQSGADVFFDEIRKDKYPCAAGFPTYKNASELDLLVVIGGDGSLLRAVRNLDDYSVPILSINRGTVGFMTEVDTDEMETLVPSLLSGGGVIEEREVLTVSACRGKACVIAGVVLNEVVIAQGTIARLVDLKTLVDGQELTTYHADGLIVSTPTGSTAYNLSAGGPIVHPSLRAMILTPINPHSFTQKPVVIRGDSKVEVSIDGKPSKYKDTNVVLTLDGQKYVSLEAGDTVSIASAPDTVKFLRRNKDTFFGSLREKLKWGERLED